MGGLRTHKSTPDNRKTTDPKIVLGLQVVRWIHRWTWFTERPGTTSEQQTINGSEPVGGQLTTSRPRIYKCTPGSHVDHGLQTGPGSLGVPGPQMVFGLQVGPGVQMDLGTTVGPRSIADPRIIGGPLPYRSTQDYRWILTGVHTTYFKSRTTTLNFLSEFSTARFTSFVSFQ